MHVHILGIGGTFMAGVARLAQQLGWRVSGSDMHLYPPMSDQLRDDGVAVMEGYSPAHLDPAPDLVVIGNVLSRGNAAVEYVLDRRLPYTSGPGFLARHVLHRFRVIAVAGTHGKTTTSSLVAWLLEEAGLKPGFLIGGIPRNFEVSARLGEGEHFVVEADEYDTAFFDKRSKFVHYQPDVLILNNLEYDHADIFPDLAAIQWQFHQLLRTVPGNGLIIAPRGDENLAAVLQKGCWTPVEYLESAEGWSISDAAADGHAFTVRWAGASAGRAVWPLSGAHNVRNALAAVAAARRAGVDPSRAAAALAGFKGVKRRMEVIATIDGVTLYDDFAHHPTAVAATLQGLRAAVGGQRIIVVLEPRSNTMRLGVHKNDLAPALAGADKVLLYQAPDLPWSLDEVAAALSCPSLVCSDVDTMVAAIAAAARPGDHGVIMSNGAFGGIQKRLQ